MSIKALCLTAILGVLAQPSALGQRGLPAPFIKPGTELTKGHPNLSDPLMYSELVDESFATTSPIKQTEGCKVLEEWQPVVVSEDHWFSVATDRRPAAYELVGVLAVAGDTNCVKPGYPMRIVALNMPSGIARVLGWFYPTSIVGPRPEYISQQETLLVSAGLMGTKAQPVFVTGAVVRVSPVEEMLIHAPRMVGARMINRTQMEAAIAEGTPIVDVRPRAQFDIARVKGAIHVPYTPGPRMHLLEDYASYVKSGDAFDIRRVPPNKDAPVILIGESWNSDNVYRAAVVLRSEGWKKIFIFHEGMDYFLGLNRMPPMHMRAARILHNLEAAAFIANKSNQAQVVDVRSDVEFAAGAIPGAYLAPYRERRDLPMRTPGLSGPALLEYGDQWVPPAGLSKTLPLVIVGESRWDWRGYKAALVARALGFQTVIWARSGMDQWASGVDRSPLTTVIKRPYPLPDGFVGGPGK
ncbi:MAG: rhodanese-like domain-containing protein [Bdellovibrionales bacterium]|nr:rhodanese-like domain-containing protein [Bdellovibrionales bacterium]